MTTSSSPSKSTQSTKGASWLPWLATGVALLGVGLPLLWNNKSIGLLLNQTRPLDPHDYLGRANRILQDTPLIDGHNDFPYLIRQQLHNEIYAHDFETQRLTSHSDFQKMREGRMGGQFWSVFVPCQEDILPMIPNNDRKTIKPDLNEPTVCLNTLLLRHFSPCQIFCPVMCLSPAVAKLRLLVGGSRHSRTN